MATIRFDAQSAGLADARQNLLNLRGEINKINVALEKNATEYRRASDSQKESLRLGREELTLARRRRTNSSAQIRLYVAQQNELQRLARDAERAARQSSRLQQTLRSIGRDAQFFAVGFAIQGVDNFVRDIVRIGSETETARATLRQFTDDVDGTFDRLQRESRSLVGIDLVGITQTFTAFRAGGAEAEQAITLIRGFTKSLTELGVSSQETSRFMQQLRQSFAANRIEGDDVKTLIEVMPTFLNRASQSLGINVESWKDLEEAIDESGKTVRQFYIDLAAQQDLQSAGADLDTYRAQVELLRETYERLARSVASVVVPALTRLLQLFTDGGFTGQISRINEVIEQAGGNVSGEVPVSVEGQRVRIRRELRDIEREIANIEASRGNEDFDRIRLRLARDLNQALERRRQIENELPATVGTRERLSIQRTLTNEIELQSRELDRFNALEQQRLDLLRQIAEFEKEITEERNRRIPPRPEPGFDGSVTAPRDLPSGQRPTTPNTRLPELRIDAADIGVLEGIGSTLDEAAQSIRRVLVEGGGGIRPDIPSISNDLVFLSRGIVRLTNQQLNLQAQPDLSEGLSDIRQVFEILRISSQDLFNRISVEARVSSIPVFDFARGLRGLGSILREAKDGADAFAEAQQRAADAEVRRTEVLSENIFRTANLPELLQLPTDGSSAEFTADTRRIDTARRFVDADIDLQRDVNRRIEDIENQRELNAREREERLTQIQIQAARRREDFEILFSRRIEEIDRNLAEERSDIYRNYVEGAIRDLNRLVLEEIQATLIRQVLSSFSGGLGVLGLIGVGTGLTVLGGILSSSRASRQRSEAESQLSRLLESQRTPIVIQNSIQYSDGSIRRQQTNATRVEDEGRTPR